MKKIGMPKVLTVVAIALITSSVQVYAHDHPPTTVNADEVIVTSEAADANNLHIAHEKTFAFASDAQVKAFAKRHPNAKCHHIKHKHICTIR